MNPKYRLELLEAFAATQPIDFHGFAVAYAVRHPEPPEEPVLAPIVEEKPVVAEEIPAVEAVVEEAPAPKRTRRKPAEE